MQLPYFCRSFQRHPLHTCTACPMYSKAVSESCRLTNQALYSHSTDMLCSYLQTKDIGCEEMCVLVTCHEQYHDWRTLCLIKKGNSWEKLNSLFRCSRISLHVLDLNMEKDNPPVYGAHSEGLFAIKRQFGEKTQLFRKQ